jgi:hypothetical protein
MRFPGIALICAAAVVLGSGSLGVDDASAAKKRKATSSCPQGTTPVVVKRGRKLVLKRNRRGRPVCKPVKRSQLRAPAKTPTLQIGQVADVLESVARINPKAFKKMERAIGKRRTNRLLTVSLEAWRKTAGAASSRRARSAADETKSFSSGGAEGSASFGLEKMEGAQSGFKAKASAELAVPRDAIDKYAGALKDELPRNVTGAKAKVDVSFEDVTAACPNDKGAVPGKLRGKGAITVTVERSDGPPIDVKLSADVDTSYNAKVGSGGKVSSIDGVEVQTTFQARSSGSSTQTYRGRRLGSGFGTEAILDAPSGGTAAAIERDWNHFDQNSGGVFGPHGSWRYGGDFPISDLRTIDNIKAMAATSIATNLLTLAAIEYLRKVTLDRIEKSACGYEVFVDIQSRTVTASYDAFGKLLFSLVTRPVAGSANRWKGSAQALFTDLDFKPKTECAMHTYVNTPGTFTVDIKQVPSGNISVTWSADPSTSASIDCPPDGSDPPHDPPPIPGMVGPSLLGATPAKYELPADGGVQAIAGGIDGGDGDGFFPTGTLRVSRTK